MVYELPALSSTIVAVLGLPGRAVELFCTVLRGDGVTGIGVPCPDPGALLALCPGISLEKLELPLGFRRLNVEPLWRPLYGLLLARFRPSEIEVDDEIRRRFWRSR